MRIEGKQIVITGASSGIGEQMAYEVAKRKAIPILLARNEKKLADMAEHIQQTYSVPCRYEALDVSDITAVEATFHKLLQEMEIDVLVNNAGFGVFRHIEDIDLTEAEKMLEVNVLGMIACTKAVYSHMINRRSGHIINIASQAGKMATPKSSVYAATKHAVLGFTNSLRMEAAQHGVFVTAVNPGPIATSFFAIADSSGSYVKNIEKWMLRPEEVARRVVDVMMTPAREVNMPGWMSVGSRLYQLVPSLVEKVAKRAFFQK
ncbi:SDR family oxidoreductase [Anoxybacillus rupiensis]|uniref:SDR family NAD(P)-dependent oxidoreductase n=1 Tax=Anoxybacteroides rupiense TaxID=311460 RepID=UPI001BA970AC|nr:SDR family oxidoreductase [Anoxybacillus rupiensis]MBS2770144.1 SDR family oxidoreductase [Anoxybacillus rupiensis]